MAVSASYSQYRTMDKVQEGSNAEQFVEFGTQPFATILQQICCLFNDFPESPTE
jgi:hypothetical protein